ncbi:beta-lactamase family protein [Sphingomonas sp. So64.6b]|nr:beta-lactamase family protein [Sphingomonas sp. So64.6b]
MRWIRATSVLLSVAVAVQPLVAQTAISTAASARDPVRDPAQAEALRLIDVWLDGVQAYERIPALSVAVVQGDSVVWSKGYGTIDAARTVPATATTIYSICSISKLFTSIALMQQWEAGKVRLDAPLTDYLPWAKLKPDARDSMPVTLRGVLTHSAGLPRESDFPYWTQADHPFPTQAQLRATIVGQAPLYPASRWYQYSNLGLTLVGETVEAIAHQPYADYVQSHILDPLALRDTRPFMPMTLYGTRLAVGWGALNRKGERALLQPFDARGLAPAAGFTSTVEDLGRFAAWQFRLLRSETTEILKPSTLSEMQRVQFTSPDWKATRGLGFAIGRRGDRTYVGHGGDCPGYHSDLLMRPESETAVASMMTGAETPGAYDEAIFALLDKRKGFAFKTPVSDIRDELDAFAGRYSAEPWGSEIVVLPWAGGLAALTLPSKNPAGELVLLKPKGGDRFRVIRDDGSESDEVVFERDAAGRISRFIRFSNPRDRIGPL